MELEVVPITKSVADEFVSKKHYSRNPSIFWAGFGLVDGIKLVGVCVYGQPSPSISSYAFKDRDFRLYELSRLVIQTNIKNAASFLVGRSLKMLPAPCAVVSYADTEYHHCGIVYQATNWIYTGSPTSHEKTFLIDGKRVHSMTLRDQGITATIKYAKENNVEMIDPLPKHRYFQFVGNKKQKKDMLNKLTYGVVKEYPKCDQNRYDDGPKLNVTVFT